MLVIDILRLSTRMFRTNRSRTILTILGISVGIGAILFLVSLGYGLQQLILNRITTSDALLSLDVTTADVSGLRMNSESEKQISAITGVDKFTIFVSGDEEAQEKITRSFVELEQEFKIIGIVEEESSSYVYLPFSVSQDLGIDNYSKIKVKADKKENLDIIRESIIDKGFMVSALSDIIEQANQIFKVVQIVLASFGIVALIVSAIGMFNTMTIALLERTQEIGIMKALGATSVD